MKKSLYYMSDVGLAVFIYVFCMWFLCGIVLAIVQSLMRDWNFAATGLALAIFSIYSLNKYIRELWERREYAEQRRASNAASTATRYQDSQDETTH